MTDEDCPEAADKWEMDNRERLTDCEHTSGLPDKWKAAARMGMVPNGGSVETVVRVNQG